MANSFTREQVLEAYKNAPVFVRDAFNAESTTDLLLDIQKRFQIHLDMAGILGKEVGYLLLGLEDPQTFTANLKNAGLPSGVVSTVVAELNQKVFIPIHDKMRKEGMGTSMASAMARPVTPAPAYGTAPAPTAPVSPLPPAPTPMPTPIAPVIPPPQPRPYTPPPLPARPVASAPLPPKTVLPGMMGNSALPPTASINRLEGRVLPPPIYDPAAMKRTPSAPTQSATTSTSRPYSADPYREPVDEAK